MTHIIIKQISTHRYEVTLNDEILCTSRDPEFAAARALLSLGVKGTLTTARPAPPNKVDMILDIERAAKLSTYETAKESPRFVLYRPFPT